VGISLLLQCFVTEAFGSQICSIVFLASGRVYYIVIVGVEHHRQRKGRRSLGEMICIQKF
jgi:cytochrome c oxidase assembly factor CtaG